MRVHLRLVSLVFLAAVSGSGLAQQTVDLSDWSLLGGSAGNMRRYSLPHNSSAVIVPQQAFGNCAPYDFNEARSLVTYVVSGPDHYHVWVTDIHGCLRRQISFNGMNDCPRLSPDGRKVLYVHADVSLGNPGKALLEFDLDTDQVSVQVPGSEDVGIGADYLPNGDGFVYWANSTTNSVLKWKHANGSVTVVGPANIFGLVRVSPDSSFVAFHSNDYGPYRIEFMRLADGVRTAGPEYGLGGFDFFPDGTLCYSYGGIRRYTPATGQIVWLVSEDLNTPTLARKPKTRYLFAFTEQNGNQDIVRMNEDGSNPVLLTTNPSNELGADLSPDGRSILFQSDRTGTFQVYKMDSDGSNVQQLTTSGVNSGARWSPDGSKIVYLHSAFNGDTGGDLFVMNADGTGAVNITNSPSFPESAAEWDPVRNRLVLSRGFPNGGANIWTMDPDGSNLEQVTNDGWDEWYPSWSCDGNWIAYHGVRDNNWEIIVVDRFGGSQRNVSNYPGLPDQAPTWTPEGNILYESGGDIYKTDINGNFRTRITNSGGVYRNPRFEMSGGIAVLPSNYYVTLGEDPDGNLSDLLESDGRYVTLFDDPNSLGAEIVFEGSARVGTACDLAFYFESRVDRGGLAYRVSLYNWAASGWTLLYGGAAPGNDTTIDVSTGVTTGSYLRNDGAVRAKVAWSPINDESPSQDGWMHRVDLARWVIY